MCRLSIGTNFHHIKIKMEKKNRANCGQISAGYVFLHLLLLYLMTLSITQIKVASNY